MTEKSNQGLEETLPRKAKLAYGGSNSALWALSNMAYTPITFYYNIKLGLSADLIGIAWLIFAIWNAGNNPFFGIIQDHTKTRWGRRIPYMRFGAPILGILFILIWIPLAGTNDQLTLFLYFLLMLFLVDTILAFMSLANGALPAEMAISSKERASLLVYANLMTAIATGVSFVLPLVLLTGDTSSIIHPLLYPAIIILAIICSVIIYYCSYYLKENQYTQLEKTLGLKDGIKETLKNKPFLIVVAVSFFYSIGNTIFLTAFYYYIDYIILLTGFMVIFPLLIIFGMVIVFSIFLKSLLKRYGVKRIYIVGLLVAGFGLIFLFFGGPYLVFALLACMPVGIGFASNSILGGVVNADTYDYDEVRTGKRRETTYGGIGALFVKPATSIANWLFLSIISATGFIKGAPVGTQPNSALLGIMIGFTLVPAVFMFISALVMKFFPLDGPKWDAQKMELKVIHDQKEKEFLEYLKEERKTN